MSLPASTATATGGTAARRVLIYRLGSLGDTVVALPCLHRVAQVYPNAERRLLTNFPVAAKAAAASAVLGASGLIHGYEPYTVGTRNLLQLASLVWRIRRWKPHVMVYLAPARGLPAAKRDAMFFRLCGIRRIIGLPDTEDLQNRRVLEGDLQEEEASRLARTLAAIGEPALDDLRNWDLGITAEERQSAADALAPIGQSPFVVISLGTKVQSNQWGISNWRAMLADLCARYPSHALVMIGAPDEHANCETVAAGWQAADDGCPVINLCGRTPPRVSAAVCARAAVFIGHDSGPLHLSACMGTPCVGIYSARNLPGVWFPHGSRHQVIYHSVDCMGCGLDTCTEQRKKCILSITVQEVLQAVDRILQKPSQAAGT